MYATVSLCLLLSAAALGAAAPYYPQGPQQRQLFYPVVPQYSQYSQYSQYPAVAPAALPYQQVYYPPQAAVAPVPALRYPAGPAPAPLASPFGLPPHQQQVLYYPGPGGPYILAGDEAANEGYWNSIYNTIANYFTGPKPAESEKPAESGSAAEGGAAEASGQKEGAKEGEKEKEGEEAKPDDSAKIKGAPQNFVLVGQPQFFGNYGLQRVNPAAVIPSANHGAVSSYLLLKNFPGVRFAPQVPQPQAADAEQVPGSAALEYQKLLQQHAASASRQQKEFDDDSSVIIDAAADAALKSAGADAEKPAEAADDAEAKPEEEETGTKE